VFEIGLWGVEGRIEGGWVSKRSEGKGRMYGERRGGGGGGKREGRGVVVEGGEARGIWSVTGADFLKSPAPWIC